MANDTFLNVSLPNPQRKNDQIFVAYSYRLYPQDDYRKVYKELEKAFHVKFIFADEKISSLHILQKIVNYIRESKFSVFDISGWNPNVTLELGLALGMNERIFILTDPAKTESKEVPSDLRGVDRIEYSSYSELSNGLTRLLSQEYPQGLSTTNILGDLQNQILDLIKSSDGLTVADVARVLSVSTDIVKVAMRPLIDSVLTSTGNTKGRKYFVKSS